MNIDINQFFIINGVLCSLVFGFVLLGNSANRRANIYLALLVFALGFNLLVRLILNEGLFNRYPYLHLLPFGINFGLGPLVLLYVRSLCIGQPLNHKPLFWLMADYPHSVFHLIFGRTFPYEPFHEVLDKFGFFSEPVLAFYIWKSYRVVLTYQSELRHKVSNEERQTLRWIKQLAWLFFFSIPVGLVFWILLIFYDLNFDYALPAYIFYTITIFWLGIGGIRQPEVVGRRILIDKDIFTAKDPNEAHLKILIDRMESHKLYLQSDLSVRDLEDNSGLTAKQISEALNNGLKKNFYQFINEYRVDEFKRRVADNPGLTLAGLALDCGFNSKTTFQRVFKEITGMKPSEYVARLEK